MHLCIDNRSGLPIYDQIYSQIKEQILTGALEENAPLPSIRGLAKDLQISVITTKRAYDELEREGFIYTQLGKGSFAAPRNRELLKERTLLEIQGHMDEILRLGKLCELSGEELMEMLRLEMEENL